MIDKRLPERESVKFDDFLSRKWLIVKWLGAARAAGPSWGGCPVEAPGGGGCPVEAGHDGEKAEHDRGTTPGKPLMTPLLPRAGVAVGGGFLHHAVDAGLGVGVGGEEVGDGADLGGGAGLGLAQQLLEGQGHIVGILVLAGQETISEVIRLRLLLAGELRVHHLVRQLAQDAVGQRSRDVSGRCQHVHCGGGIQAHLVGVEGVLEGHVADLVPDDAEGFLIRHNIQQAGVHAHVPIRASKRIHLVILVDLEGQRGAVHLGKTLGNLVQTGHIGAAGDDLVLGVQLGDRLRDIALDLGIGDGKGLEDLGAQEQRASAVEMIRMNFFIV